MKYSTLRHNQRRRNLKVQTTKPRRRHWLHVINFQLLVFSSNLLSEIQRSHPHLPTQSSPGNQPKQLHWERRPCPPNHPPNLHPNLVPTLPPKPNCAICPLFFLAPSILPLARLTPDPFRADPDSSEPEMEYEAPAHDRRKSGTLQTQNQSELQKQNDALQQQLVALRQQQSAQPNVAGGRIAPVRQSRILDRPPKKGEKDSSLKIKVELDLEVEVSRLPTSFSSKQSVVFWVFYKMIGGPLCQGEGRCYYWIDVILCRWICTPELRVMLRLVYCEKCFVSVNTH